MNKCKICNKLLIKTTSNACTGICQNRYRKLMCILGYINLDIKMNKELNKGFSYDEPSVLI